MIHRCAVFSRFGLEVVNEEMTVSSTWTTGSPHSLASGGMIVSSIFFKQSAI